MPLYEREYCPRCGSLLVHLWALVRRTIYIEARCLTSHYARRREV